MGANLQLHLKAVERALLTYSEIPDVDAWFKTVIWAQQLRQKGKASYKGKNTNVRQDGYLNTATGRSHLIIPSTILTRAMLKSQSIRCGVHMTNSFALSIEAYGF